ncbi:hypothetical protein JQC92_19415 [Shewanella sp. 202IG2-18]|uniref:hypothetical protein n=1 Tax=Parashewanella hymeniacidonis TaxID=2807618 RepID=UPI001960C6F9|nr:hypothetical protein [Parashewanella hymeniacidonis]MBM7074171.1 hypothetical protein [Parashewanella hymeniacidonis]
MKLSICSLTTVCSILCLMSNMSQAESNLNISSSMRNSTNWLNQPHVIAVDAEPNLRIQKISLWDEFKKQAESLPQPDPLDPVPHGKHAWSKSWKYRKHHEHQVKVSAGVDKGALLGTIAGVAEKEAEKSLEKSNEPKPQSPDSSSTGSGAPQKSSNSGQGLKNLSDNAKTVIKNGKTYYQSQGKLYHYDWSKHLYVPVNVKTHEK